MQDDAAVPAGSPAVLVYDEFDLTTTPWVLRAVFEVRALTAAPASMGLAGTGSNGAWTVCALRQSMAEAAIQLYFADLNGNAVDFVPGTTPFPVIPVGDLVLGILRTIGRETLCSGIVVDHQNSDAARTPGVIIENNVAAVRSLTLYYRPGG